MKAQIKIRQEKPLWNTLWQCLGLLLFSLILTACGQDSDSQQGVISGNQFSAPLPKAITVLLADNTRLIVDLVIDGSVDKAIRVENLTVDSAANAFSGNVPEFPTGTYALLLVYSIEDLIQGIVEVMRTSEIAVTVVANQDTLADFSDSGLTYIDTDEDGINNLAELSAGTDVNIPNYAVGGQVEKLEGSGLILQNNGDDDRRISVNGPFSFTPSMVDGEEYAVSVFAQPTKPNQVCNVNNGKGKIESAAVSNVTVICSTKTYTIGGTVFGYTGAGLILQNNKSDNLLIDANGNFSFSTAIVDGGGYDVSVLIQPSNPSQVCSVNNGMGEINGAAVTVTVSCFPVIGDPDEPLLDDSQDTGAANISNYTVSGKVEGLTGSGLVLRNNNNDDLPMSDSGTFSFNNVIADGSGYAVTVLTQPSSPDQVCIVNSGSGTISGENIANVNVICSDVSNSFSSPRGIVLDVGNGRDRVLVVDEVAVIAVDLVTGVRTILSDNTTPDTSDPFSSLRGITLDTENGRNRALVVDQTLGSVIAIDLTNGKRSVLSDNLFSFPVGIILDAVFNRALVVDFSQNAVIAVDLDTGVSTILSNNTTPNADNPFSVLRSITLDRDKNRALVLMEDTLDTVIAVDLSSGVRTVLSNNTTPDDSISFLAPRGIALDTNNNRNRALVVDKNLEAILTVDLDSGVRKVLSNSTIPDDNNLFSSPKSIVVDTANGRERALVVDSQRAAVISVDLVSGARTVFSDATVP